MSEQPLLPGLPTPQPATTPPPPLHSDLRLLRPERDQTEWVSQHLDSLLPDDHPARAIWRFLEQLDLSAFYASVKAEAHGRGRSATDPQVLLALWLLATVEGVGSARKLERLSEQHDAYRWVRGGVPVNYHLLSDFRAAHREALDDLLTQIIAALMSVGLATLYRVSQDGMRVRANAGASSFRRKNTLRRCLQEAREQVAYVAREREAPDPTQTKRQQVARARAAREREERVAEALRQLPEVEAAKERQKHHLPKARRKKVSEARVSTTDPDARVLKMPDGGFRPAYNIQLATDTESGVIVGMEVVNRGDEGQASPMEEQVAARTRHHPATYLMDGSFATREDITTLEQRGIPVYAPIRLPKDKPEEERYRPRYGDSPQVKAWRERMATPEAQLVYRQRAASAEWSNAQLRQHGITRFTVAGISKVTIVALLAVVAHNLLRWAALTA